MAERLPPPQHIHNRDNSYNPNKVSHARDLYYGYTRSCAWNARQQEKPGTAGFELFDSTGILSDSQAINHDT